VSCETNVSKRTSLLLRSFECLIPKSYLEERSAVIDLHLELHSDEGTVPFSNHIMMHADCGHWLENQQFNGWDLDSFTVASKESCLTACSSRSLCNALTVDATNTCKLKNMPSSVVGTASSGSRSIRVR
jgi:hypothetical protein